MQCLNMGISVVASADETHLQVTIDEFGSNPMREDKLLFRGGFNYGGTPLAMLGS